MRLTSSQAAALKADFNANTNTVTYLGNTVQIKDLPVQGDAEDVAAAWYNGLASPAYWVWKTTVTRSDVYHEFGPESTFWDWGTYKAQTAVEQGAWTQMFMGDQAPPIRLNFRDGVAAIFSGSGAPATQRAHIFAACRRLGRRLEKLLSAAPVQIGSIVPSATNGNNLASALGSTANPAVMSWLFGECNGQDIEDARLS